MNDAAIYLGRVRHKRFRPRVHRFSYPVWYLKIDVDHLDNVADTESPAWLSFNRFNLFSLWRRDYGRKGSAITLKADISGLLSGVAPNAEPARIMLFTMPRLLGYSFNPLSIYLCYDDDDQLCGVVYEVNNTFGEKHFYAVAVDPGIQQLHHGARKLFHVSPFYPVAGHYDFRLNPGQEKFALAIRYTGEDGGRDLFASLCASAMPLTAGNLIGQFARMPLVTFKVTFAIHFEALRLWLKGLPIFRKPAHVEDSATHCQPN